MYENIRAATVSERTPGGESACLRAQVGIFSQILMVAVRMSTKILLACVIFSFQSLEAQAASNSPVQVIEKVQQLLQQGDLLEARSQLIQALRQHPAEAALYNLLGVVEAQQGNYRRAEANFNQAIKLAPRFTGALLNLGRLYQENLAVDPEALQKGLKTYQELLRFQSDNIEANYQSAVLLQLQGNFQASLDHLSRLPPDQQGRSQALAVRCADLAALGRNSDADTVATRLLSSPGLAEADILAILPALDTLHFDDLELRLLVGLEERRITSLNTLRRLAMLYERLGQLGRARDAAEKVAAQSPSSVAPLLDLARVAYKQRDLKGALGYLAHARDLEPNNAAIHFFFGMVCVDLDLGSEAHQSLKQAVDLDPNNAYYNYAMGAVSIHRRDQSEAIPYFQKYCELKPQDLRGKFALGAAYFYSGNAELARKELREVVKRRDIAAGAHYFLALLAKQEGRLDEAISELEQALEINANYADAHAALGLLRLENKEYQSAEKSLLRAIEIEPEHYLANLNLLILYRRIKDPRVEAQARKFDQLKEKQSQKAQEFLRNIEVRPY